MLHPAVSIKISGMLVRDVIITPGRSLNSNEICSLTQSYSNYTVHSPQKVICYRCLSLQQIIIQEGWWPWHYVLMHPIKHHSGVNHQYYCNTVEPLCKGHLGASTPPWYREGSSSWKYRKVIIWGLQNLSFRGFCIVSLIWSVLYWRFHCTLTCIV